ncbi:helix-turn-helix domain-containing protein [Rhodococcus hoagii]|nr:helix-turn-helix domain-containing protein [Prescottella equi]NKS05220.1 helix-turn-helix domain-containing protein [Prescottella equi]NKS86983.1 helix-turn-helix domain-containing protein [Prescottella equi]NKS92669.1 helix-turn-helix domain-containing protein [Prescottella equi]NKT12101.1 helix-turn-helix domain-containing protein [Prescottella equi]
MVDLDAVVARRPVDTDAVAAHKARMLRRLRGRRLAERREASGLSRSDVAAHAGIDPAAVAAIEDGDLDALTVATVRAYTDTLGVGLRLEVDLGENRIHLA